MTKLNQAIDQYNGYKTVVLSGEKDGQGAHGGRCHKEPIAND